MLCEDKGGDEDPDLYKGKPGEGKEFYASGIYKNMCLAAQAITEDGPTKGKTMFAATVATLSTIALALVEAAPAKTLDEIHEDFGFGDLLPKGLDARDILNG